MLFSISMSYRRPICSVKPIEATTTNLDAIKLLLNFAVQISLLYFQQLIVGRIAKGKFCDENTHLKSYFYGKLKVDAENAILNSGNSITLRLATVFGVSPRMRLDL